MLRFGHGSLRPAAVLLPFRIRFSSGFCKDLYVLFGRGPARCEPHDGVLFVIDMGSRQLTVLAGGSVYKVINAGEAETITDNVYRMAGRGEYAACAQEVFREVLLLLRGEQIARPMKLVSNLLLALTLALLAMYLFIHFRYEAHPAEGKGGAVLPVTAATAAAFTASLTARNAVMTKQKKVNISSSSGGGSGGGGHSGGGGGGFSGGGGSHGF